MTTENTASNEVERDEYGFDSDGVHLNGTAFDEGGFDEHGIHCDTGTVFNDEGRTRDGGRFDEYGYDCDGYDRSGYNEEGYDSEGYDRDGFDCDGYDSDGYNEDGYHRHGGSRCENGDCNDEDCSCREEGSDELLEYNTCVLEETGWKRHRYKRTTPTVAFEFECIGHEDANTGAAAICGPYNRAYRELIGGTEYGHGSIAKRDGSLPDRTGLEFVTVPMTLDEHRKVLAAAFPDGRLGNGAVSAWSRTQCGMHVHLARSSVSPLTLGKMLCFMHLPANVGFHIDIACRQTHYASFPSHRSLVSTGLPYKADQSDKYSALNVKRSTVEFRIFRPSARTSNILKNLCYVLAVRDFCRQASADRRKLSPSEFLTWLGTTDARFEYIELDQWLRSHDSAFGRMYATVAKPSIKPRKDRPAA
jgi:hypothetical protein